MPNTPTESAPAIISLWGCEKISHSIERWEVNALKRSVGPWPKSGHPKMYDKRPSILLALN